MSYILKLAGWYPSRVDAFNGDFVQRHAKSIATQKKIVVVYVVKDKHATEKSIEKITDGNLTEIIGYYPKAKFVDTLQSHITYLHLMKSICAELFEAIGMPELVHVNIVWKAGLVAKYLKSQYGLSYCLTENWTGYYPEDPNYIKKSTVREALYKAVYKNAAYLLPVSLDLAKRCNFLFNTNLAFHIVENAVDVTQFTYTEKVRIDVVHFVHISTMGYQKNTISLVAVFKEVLKKKPNYRLQLIGPLSKEVDLFLAQNEDLKDKISTTGNIKYQQVAVHLQQADCLVLFSRYENLPCVVLESFCCGVPVIATDVGGIREVLDNTNGVLIPSEDKEALANALINFDLSKYDNLKIASKAQLAYSYEAIGKKYIKAYSSFKS